MIETYTPLPLPYNALACFRLSVRVCTSKIRKPWPWIFSMIALATAPFSRLATSGLIRARVVCTSEFDAEATSLGLGTMAKATTTIRDDDAIRARLGRDGDDGSIGDGKMRSGTKILSVIEREKSPGLHGHQKRMNDKICYFFFSRLVSQASSINTCTIHMYNTYI